MSNALLRILTAVIGAPLVFGLAYLGSWPFGILVLVVALLAQHELYGLAVAAGYRPYRGWGLLIGACVALWPLAGAAVAVAAAVAVVLIAVSPLMSEEKTSPASLAATFFGVVYPTAFVSTLTDLRLARGPDVTDGGAFALTISILLLVWATDIAAYYVGGAIGKRPLAPAVSPKKTREGAVGGAVAAFAVAVVLKLTILAFLPWIHVLGLALICGVVGQLGDLAESRMKRAAGVKDSGTLLPGHGGLLDRFDALIVVAPAAYLYLRFVARIFAE